MSDLPIVRYASLTDVGMRRATNQDALAVRLSSDFNAWACDGHLFVVADGMGGHAVGDLASRIATETLPQAWAKSDPDEPAQRLQAAIQASNKAINDRAVRNPEFQGMGTTCSVLNLSAKGALIGHVGDSRVYRLRHGLLQQLTFDHSLQWEMIRLGRSTAENVEKEHPRNVITRCLGPDLNVAIDIEGPFSAVAGDVFVLCSDGLTNHVDDAEIGRAVSDLPVTESARFLINLANCRGGSDNSTVIVVRVEEYPAVSGTVADTVFIEPSPPAPPPPTAGKRLLPLLRLIPPGVFAAGAAVAFQQGLNAASGVLAVTAMISLPLLFRKPRKKVKHPLPKPAPEVSQDSRPHLDSCSLLRSSFLPMSPYRSTESSQPDILLQLTTSVYNELQQHAVNAGWRKAVNPLAESETADNRSIEERLREAVKSVNTLMRDFYSAVRGSTGGGI